MTQASSRTAHRQSYDMTPIARLLARCRPAYIARLVAALIVDTIKRRSFRTRPDVRQEHDEVITPLRRHPDSSPTVEGVISVARILATLLHCAPRPIFSRACRAVREFLRSRRLSTKAAAASDEPRAQMILPHPFPLSALAHTLDASPDAPPRLRQSPIFRCLGRHLVLLPRSPVPCQSEVLTCVNQKDSSYSSSPVPNGLSRYGAIIGTCCTLQNARAMRLKIRSTSPVVP